MGRGGYILGGLLQGAGAGLALQAEQMRENALEALRNDRIIAAEGRQDQRVIAAEGRAEVRDNTAATRDAQVRAGLLALAHEYNLTEAEVTQQYTLEEINERGRVESGHITQRAEEDRRTEAQKAEDDRNLARLRSSLNITEDAASQRLGAEIDAGEVRSIEQADDGRMLIVYTDGRTVRQNVNLRAPGGDDDEEGGTIAAARARQSGAPEPDATRAPARRAPASDGPPSGSASRQDSRQIELAVSRMVEAGQLAPGTRVGETVTAPAGALAGFPVTVVWDGQRWTYPQD